MENKATLTFTVNLNSWCPNPTAEDGYSECSAQ